MLAGGCVKWGSVKKVMIDFAKGSAVNDASNAHEALQRWESEGGVMGGKDAAIWLSIAFKFARSDRTPSP